MASKPAKLCDWMGCATPQMLLRWGGCTIPFPRSRPFRGRARFGLRASRVISSVRLGGSRIDGGSQHRFGLGPHRFGLGPLTGPTQETG
eukprot:12669754-Alexandrium_andersonii.AAC.1